MRLKVINQDQQEITITSASDFERALNVRYLSSLEYKDEKVKEVISRKYAKACAKGWITDRQKWLGHYYGAGLAGSISLKLKITWIDEEIGYGVFADQEIPKRTYIGEYTGILRKRVFFGRWENLYCFDYTIGEARSTSYVIDAQDAANHTRFINHSFEPNVGLVSVEYEGFVRVLLYAKRAISKGEQLCYDYGDDYWMRRKAPRQL